MAPVIDTLLTATNLTSALYVAGQDNVTNKGTSVGLGLAVASIWALSAGYGYSWTGECKEAQEGQVDVYIPRPRPAGYMRRPVQRQGPVPAPGNSFNRVPNYPAAPAAPVTGPALQTPSAQSRQPPVVAPPVVAPAIVAPPAAPPAPPPVAAPPAPQLRDDDEPL